VKVKMPDRVLIPLPGIGTLSLTRADYEAALIPIAPPTIATTAFVPIRRAEPAPVPAEPSEHLRGLRFLRLREVCARVELKPAMIYRLMGLGRFPPRVKISERASRWVESEVESFMAERVAERVRTPGSTVPVSSPYMRMGEVMKHTGLNASAIYTLIKDGSFPKWANLPKIASGWLKADIEAWLVARNDSLTARS
jgi:prophage regulatory protein